MNDVLTLIDDHVRARPTACAVSGVDGRMSYAELDDTADAISGLLRKAGLQDGELVGLQVPPSAAGVGALLGVLRAGGVLLALDPSQPPAQQQRILDDAGVRLTLATESGSVTVVERGSEPRVIDDAADLAYVIYTSGSTGKPKGVLCRHSALANCAAAQRQVLGVRPTDVVAQIAPWNVDAALFEIVLALTAGAELHIAEWSQRYPGPPLERFLRTAEATVLVAVPSTLRALRPAEVGTPRLVVSAGEDLPPDLAGTWAPGRRLVNAYGVTEGTIWSSLAEVSGDGAIVTLGSAIPGCRLTLRDPDLAPTPDGRIGEICVEGVGVAAGYLDRPDLTAMRFVDGPDGRLFRSGDRGIRHASGSIRFLGREDDQVKLGGLRVELGEVRQILLESPAVLDCAVRPDRNRLVAWVVPAPGHDVGQIALTEWMEERLPLPMVPSLYVGIAALPRTAWGKVDMAALPEPAAVVAGAQGSVAAGSGADAELARLTAGILGLPHVAPGDDLFMIGMTSLTLARLMATVFDEFGVEVDPVDVFENPTVAELAELIDGRRRELA